MTRSERLKRRAVVEFLAGENSSAIDSHRRMKAAYGDEHVDISIVRRRAVRARNEESSGSALHLCDKEQGCVPQLMNLTKIVLIDSLEEIVT